MNKKLGVVRRTAVVTELEVLTVFQRIFEKMVCCKKEPTASGVKERRIVVARNQLTSFRRQRIHEVYGISRKTAVVTQSKPLTAPDIFTKKPNKTKKTLRQNSRSRAEFRTRDLTNKRYYPLDHGKSLRTTVTSRLSFSVFSHPTNL